MLDRYYIIGAVCLVVAFHYVMRYGSRLVERYTGRETQPDRPSNAYDALYFVLVSAFVIPPIYLWPDAHPLITAAFMIVGVAVGTLTAQAAFGRRKQF